MEEMPKQPVLKLTWEEVKSVRQECNMADPKYITDGIDNIIEWYKLQPHMLKKSLDRAFVERVLLLARGSVEIAKKKIDAIATVRTMMPEFYKNRDIENDEFKNFVKFIRPVVLPTLNKDLTRIIIIQMTSQATEEQFFEPLSFFRFLILINDNRMYMDYIAGDTYVIDMSNFRLMDFVNMNLSIIKKIQIMTSAYSIKLKGIHFLNAPTYIDKVIFIMKQGLKEKIADRVHAHATYEDFYKFVPEDRLPVEYGGPLKSMGELYDEWIRYLKSDVSKKNSIDAVELLTVESKRTGEKKNEEMLGIPGSFRTLYVD